MGKNIVVFDIETKNTFDEVGGRDGFAKLGISVLGLYDYEDGEFRIYEEGELGKFAERLSRRPLLVGFNSRKFDVPVLQPYIKFGLAKFPQLDIMEEITNFLGHRVSLDSVAQATLNAKKSGSGLDAIKYFREGRFDELKKYCLDDVRLTRDLYEHGAKHGELLCASKFGGDPKLAKVSWKIENPEEAAGGNPQQSLF